jgi:hypothetical protein
MRVSMRATTLCGFIRASSEEQTRHPMRGTRGPVATARRSASVATTSGGTMGRDSNLSSQSGTSPLARVVVIQVLDEKGEGTWLGCASPSTVHIEEFSRRDGAAQRSLAREQ